MEEQKKEEQTTSSKSKRKQSGELEAEKIENYRIAFQNSKENKEVKACLENLGYNETKMAEGEAIYEKAKAILKSCKQKKSNYTIAREFWHQKYNLLQRDFNRHRKLAKVLYKKGDPEYVEMELGQVIVRRYSAHTYMMSRFYNTIVENPSIIASFSTLNVLDAELKKGLEDVKEVEITRSSVLNSSGIAQDETTKKHKAMAELNEWMTNFFRIARIALENEPQLLESLGIVVK